MKSYNDDGAAPTAASGTTLASDGRPTVRIGWEYDAVGNIRRMSAAYDKLDEQGVVIDSTQRQDYWYLYDAMNRFTLTKGMLTAVATDGTVTTGSSARGNGTILRSTTGTSITYDAAGERKTAVRTIASGTGWVAQRDDYAYTADGYLQTVRIGTGLTKTDITKSDPTTPGSQGSTRASYVRDTLGNVTDYTEYDAASALAYSRHADFNDRNQVTNDVVTSVRSDGRYVSSTAFSYTSPGGGAGRAEGSVTPAFSCSVRAPLWTQIRSALNIRSPSLIAPSKLRPGL